MRGQRAWLSVLFGGGATKYMKKIKIAATIVLVLCLVGIIAILVFREKEYTGYEVVRELENSEISEYTVSDGKLIRCGTEGAQAVNGSGNLLWNITYSTMKNPQFVFCGEMTAIADIGAKTFLLADGSGVSHQYTTPYPIQWICVAKQGVTAVLMNGEEKDYIYLYSKSGELLSEIETIVARDGFPITMALSEDGKKLVTSYMKIEGDEPESCVTFYNFGEVGQNSIRNLVGQVQYTECLVPRLAFWDNNTVVAVGEHVMEFFTMKETPESVFKKEIPAEIKSISVGEYLCMLTKSKDGQEVLEAYNKSGTVCMKKTITFPYIGMHTAEQEVVLYSYSDCEIYSIKDSGKLLYKGSFENGVRNLFVIGKNRYYLVENRRIRVIKLV